MTQENIGLAAVNALINEVSVTPKPGLVDRVSSGAHADMDYGLFLKSARSLGDYFTKAADIGSARRDTAVNGSSGPDYGEIFSGLRREGIKAEQTMNEATGGVNTHRGAIFTLGILCAAAATAQTYGSREPSSVLTHAGKIAAFSLDDFGRGNFGSYGLEAYGRYGSRGIRGEAADGYPSVLKYGFPVFSSALGHGLSLNDAALLSLLMLICVSDDTVLMKRCGGPDAAAKEKKKVRDLLSGRTGTLREKTRELGACWSPKGISAGGSADLLSAVLFLSSFTGLIPDDAEPDFHACGTGSCGDTLILDLLPDLPRQFLVLSSREDRWARRLSLASQGYTVLCATAAVPHTVRYEGGISSFLRAQTEIFIGALPEKPVICDFSETSDGPVFIAAFSGTDAPGLKRKAAAFEDSLPARRLLDIDVTSPDGKTVGGADIGRAPRPCIVCGGNAKVCMRAHAHTDGETVRAVIDLLERQETRT